MTGDDDFRTDQKELRKDRRQAIDEFIKAHSADKLRQQTADQLRQLLSVSPDPRLKKVSVKDIQTVIRARITKPISGVKR